MLRTITIGSTLQIQGVPVGQTKDGRLLVRDGDRIFAGMPVPRWTDGGSRLKQMLAKPRKARTADAS